jgi:hypothetical protein
VAVDLPKLICLRVKSEETQCPVKSVETRVLADCRNHSS